MDEHTGTDPAGTDPADIDALVASARDRLVQVLAGLDAAGWDTPSLCAGWSVRHVVVHVLMPYEMSRSRFLRQLVAARFSFDRAADAWARSDRRSTGALLDGLRASARRRFAVPGAPAEAPLSHLVLHSEDIHRALGTDPGRDPAADDVVLDQLTAPRARRSLAPGLLDGLALRATDTGWRSGDGDLVTGTASALMVTLAGRTAALDELTGPGADRLRTRVRTR
jgi:uncharacterized protein (TIGR03083 family)